MCVAYSNKNVTYASVIEAVGMTDRETLKEITKCVLIGEQGDLLSTINRIANLGKNLTQVAKDLVSFVRDVLIVKTCKDYKDILKLSNDQILELEELSKLSTNEKLIEILNKLSALDNDFRYSSCPRNLLEITLVTLCGFEMTELNELKTQVKMLEKKLAQKE